MVKLRVKFDEDVNSLAIVSKRIAEKDPILASERREPKTTALMSFFFLIVPVVSYSIE